MSGSKTRATNEQALQAARQRDALEGQYLDRVGQQLSSKDYSDGDRARLTQLQQQLTKARSEIQAEVGAREELKKAYDDSTFDNKDADPAVKAAAKKLAAVNKANKPVNAKDNKGKNLVTEVCQPCLDKALAVQDCNTPAQYNMNGSRGPAYKRCGHHTLASYAGWDDLVKSGKKTPSEKNVLVAMSRNEGDLDDVQAYDSEALTMGAMQKTVNPAGGGELPAQLAAFRDSTPANKAVFDRELGAKGYSVEGTGRQATLQFQDPAHPGAAKITGPALKSFIRDHADRWKDTLGPFRSLGRTPEFQRQQVMDFNTRLVEAVNLKPQGYTHPIKSYVTSEYGSSLVLDQSVNRPGLVSQDFGSALNGFYAAHPQASRNPADWTGEQRRLFESDIADRYASLRRGTDMAGRAERLTGALSHDPGTLTFPPGA